MTITANMATTMAMSVELYWLLITVLMTALMWVPYIINRIAERGVIDAFWDRFGHTHAKSEWANRMMNAHSNAVENLAVFAPLVILVAITGSSSELTVLAVQIYFYARLVHYLVYTLAVPLLRVVSFLVGFASQMMLVIVGRSILPTTSLPVAVRDLNASSSAAWSRAMPVSSQRYSMN